MKQRSSSPLLLLFTLSAMAWELLLFASGDVSGHYQVEVQITTLTTITSYSTTSTSIVQSQAIVIVTVVMVTVLAAIGVVTRVLGKTLFKRQPSFPSAPLPPTAQGFPEERLLYGMGADIREMDVPGPEEDIIGDDTLSPIAEDVWKKILRDQRIARHRRKSTDSARGLYDGSMSEHEARSLSGLEHRGAPRREEEGGSGRGGPDGSRERSQEAGSSGGGSGSSSWSGRREAGEAGGGSSSGGGSSRAGSGDSREATPVSGGGSSGGPGGDSREASTSTGGGGQQVEQSGGGASTDRPVSPETPTKLESEPPTVKGGGEPTDKLAPQQPSAPTLIVSPVGPSEQTEEKSAHTPESVTKWSDLPDKSQNQLYDMVKNPQDQNYVPEAVDWALGDGYSVDQLLKNHQLLQAYAAKERQLQKDRQQWYEQEYRMRGALEHEQSRKYAAEMQKDKEWMNELSKMFSRGDPRARKAWDKEYEKWLKAGRPVEGDKEYKKWLEAGR